MPESAHRADRMRVRTFNSYQRVSKPLFRLRPTLSDGIIVIAGRVPEAA
jgi:hypothetical protein